jgi:sulfate permease, SulP family
MQRFFAPLKNEQWREQLPRSLIVGIIIGLFEVIFAISLASFLFSGELHLNLADGIGIVLITIIVSSIVNALFSPTAGLIVNIQGSYMIVLNVAIISYLASSNTAPQDLLPTVLVIISLSTLLTGIVFFAFGHFRLSRLVQYIPYPVVGGFLAGTGCLIIVGAISTMLNSPLSFENLPSLIQIPQLVLWLPGLVLGLSLTIALRYINHLLAMPGLLLAGFVLFYALMLLSGTSINAAIGNGLLLGDIGGEIRWQPLSWAILVNSDWHTIFSHSGTILTSMTIALITLMLYLSGIELSLKQELDVNGELKAQGIANLVSGLLGGSLGLASIPLTVLGSRLNAQTRLTSIVVSLVALLVLLFGSALLAFVPKAVLGGLLIYMGFSFINDWIIEGFNKFSRSDYAIVWLIVFSIVFIGFLEGVAIGLILTILVFVLNYSQISIFYRKRSGSELKSNVERSPHYTKELKGLMKGVYVVELQGFLFFGTAIALLDTIRERLADTNATQLHYLILDFRRVRGIDTSAILSFSKAVHLAKTKEFVLIFTGIHAAVEAQLAFLATLKDHPNIQIEASLDYGVEYCEKNLLESALVTEVHIPSTLFLQLRDMGMEIEAAKRLAGYLEILRLSPNEYLIRQHDEANDLYFVQIGQLSTFLELDDGQRLRLRTTTMGTMVGEMSYYLNTQRSASVIADMHSVVHRLSAASIQEMRVKDPQLALALNELVTRVIANRLVNTNQAIAAMN